MLLFVAYSFIIKFRERISFISDISDYQQIISLSMFQFSHYMVNPENPSGQ